MSALSELRKSEKAVRKASGKFDKSLKKWPKANRVCRPYVEPTETRPLLTPINDRVLVRLFEHPSEEQKIGSIIVPEIAREKENICGSQVFLDKPMHRGTVVAAGPGALVNLTCKRCGDEKIVRREMSVKPGDIIYFGHFFDLSIDNLILLREDDILGVER